ncbi:hypothetical protein QAD02_011696 [Eretmocerus hayati]|uniref:Uncharacterized protein n=1 Tax=Eretmocerus hayati TaxID=131215 RepID=A0ACC2NX81_9HYME|nr:hypothetical protein QAD02_011696 [Eretmocerus hayati]
MEWEDHSIPIIPVRDQLTIGATWSDTPVGPAQHRTRTGRWPVWDWRDVVRHSRGTCTTPHCDRLGTSLGLARRDPTLPWGLHDIAPRPVSDNPDDQEVLGYESFETDAQPFYSGPHDPSRALSHTYDVTDAQELLHCETDDDNISKVPDYWFESSRTLEEVPDHLSHLTLDVDSVSIVTIILDMLTN